MVRVRVIPLSTPPIERRCPRCDRRRPFASSDRFRVNAQKGRLDVWLIYRCTVCDETFNLEVLARVPVGEVPPERLRAYHENDRALAWAVAFAAPAAGEVEVRVECVGEDASTIQIELEHPCRVRLDRLLCAALGGSRAEIARRAGPAWRRALRRPAAHGQTIPF